MEKYKLTIGMLPKGSWNNDLSKILAKKDWDSIRNLCYDKANGKCEICGYPTKELDAHEIWDFDIQTKTQTLKDIVAICSKCHGVQHFRNSVRLGYLKDAKAHFIKTNRCSEIEFATELTKAIDKYNELNQIYRWHIQADLSKYGCNDKKVKNKYIPLIKNPYENVEFQNLRMAEIKKYFFVSEQIDLFDPPKVISIKVDNYQGKIKVDALFVDRIEWILDEEKIKTSYNTTGRMIEEFSVEDLYGKSLYFKIINQNGVIISKDFILL